MQSLLKNCMKASLPVLEEANEAKLIFVLPLPRYAPGLCCQDPEHIANLDEDNFDTILRDSVRVAEKIIKQEMRKMDKAATIFDPLSPFDTTVQCATIGREGHNRSLYMGSDGSSPPVQLGQQ